DADELRDARPEGRGGSGTPDGVDSSLPSAIEDREDPGALIQLRPPVGRIGHERGYACLRRALAQSARSKAQRRITPSALRVELTWSITYRCSPRSFRSSS